MRSQPEIPTQRTVSGFVDQVAEEVALVLLPDVHGNWEGYRLPKTLLPLGVKEGMWLQVQVQRHLPDQSPDGKQLRRSFSRQDQGGDFRL